MGGAFAQALGGILLRVANFMSQTLGVNALAYFVPVLSLVWLWVSGEAGVARWDLLIVGSLMVVLSNGLIGLQGRLRSSGSCLST